MTLTDQFRAVGFAVGVSARSIPVFGTRFPVFRVPKLVLRMHFFAIDRPVRVR